MRGGKIVILALAALCVSATSLAVAQEKKKATGVVAVRQLTMKANGDHTAAIKTILTETPELTRQVAFHAEAIAESLETVPEIFPEGSTQEPTEALPTIWQKPDEFKQAASRAKDLAMRLASAAETGDTKATLAAFGSMGKDGCSGCHQTFRKPQK
jgi:cytochrome c556